MALTDHDPLLPTNKDNFEAETELLKLLVQKSFLAIFVQSSGFICKEKRFIGACLDQSGHLRYYILSTIL